jgi:hypothetical protein
MKPAWKGEDSIEVYFGETVYVDVHCIELA